MSVASVRGLRTYDDPRHENPASVTRFSRGGFFRLGCLSTTRVPLPRLQWCIRCAQPVPRLPPTLGLRSHGQPYAPPVALSLTVSALCVRMLTTNKWNPPRAC
jgi:hypothetical protein